MSEYATRGSRAGEPDEAPRPPRASADSGPRPPVAFENGSGIGAPPTGPAYPGPPPEPPLPPRPHPPRPTGAHPAWNPGAAAAPRPSAPVPPRPPAPGPPSFPTGPSTSGARPLPPRPPAPTPPPQHPVRRPPVIAGDVYADAFLNARPHPGTNPPGRPAPTAGRSDRWNTDTGADARYGERPAGAAPWDSAPRERPEPARPALPPNGPFHIPAPSYATDPYRTFGP